LESLDGVLKDWLDGLHDSKSSFHVVDLWLHAFNGLHLSGNFDEWLSVIESLQDSSSEGFLDVLDGSGLGNGGIVDTVSLGVEGSGELVLHHNEEFIVSLVLEGGLSLDEVMVVVVMSGGGTGDESDKSEFHLFLVCLLL